MILLPADGDRCDPDENNADGDECSASDCRDTCGDIAAAGVVDASEERLGDHEACVDGTVLRLLVPLVAVFHLWLRHIGAEGVADVLINGHEDGV